MHHRPAASRSIKLMQRDKERERKQKAGANTDPVFFITFSLWSRSHTGSKWAALPLFDKISRGTDLKKNAGTLAPKSDISHARRPLPQSHPVSTQRPTLFILQFFPFPEGPKCSRHTRNVGVCEMLSLSLSLSLSRALSLAGVISKFFITRMTTHFLTASYCVSGANTTFLK